MTATLDTLPPSARDALRRTLDRLLDQRVLVFAESTTNGGSGDAADRADNVEAIIRLEALDARIAEVRDQLQAPDTKAAEVGADAAVTVGSVVSLRFDEDEPAETFLVGLLEQAGVEAQIVTPASPLGRALLGARPGDEVTYSAARGGRLRATVVSVGG